MTGGRTGAHWVGTAMLVALLAACGGGQDTRRTKRRWKPARAEEIYKRGEYELEAQRKPDDAIRYFSEVERLYPYSEWAKRALIMQAFSYHKDGRVRRRARRPRSAISTSIRVTRMRPMRSICWRCPITTRSTRSAATRA